MDREGMPINADSRRIRDGNVAVDDRGRPEDRDVERKWI
jgi:hypothetical protein